jgi:hypothetical protein
VIASVLPCVETPDDPAAVEDAFATMTRERDRIDAEIARLTEARGALDVVIEGNNRHRTMPAAEPVARSA